MTVQHLETVPLDDERRDWINRRELKGGEVPNVALMTPEGLAHHVEVMVVSFWRASYDDEGEKLRLVSDAELVYTTALGALRRMRDLALPAGVKFRVVHVTEHEHSDSVTRWYDRSVIYEGPDINEAIRLKKEPVSYAHRVIEVVVP